MEVDEVQETTIEVTTLQESKNEHNQDTLEYEASPNLQHENQNWETLCIKPELDHSIRSTSTGTSDNSHCSEIIDEENICADNRNILHNGLCSQEILEHDISTSDDLRQFDVLDDLDRHSEQNCSDADSDTDDSMDSDVPDEEIEAMLEEGAF